MAGPFSCVLRGWVGVWCRQEFVRSRSFRILGEWDEAIVRLCRPNVCNY